MNWSKEQINKMTSDEYKQALETHGDDFRRAVDAADSQPASRRANGNVRDAAESAPTKTFADSPEWADEPSVAAPTATEPVAAATEEELPILIHEFQPVSKDTGKPVGGKQVFKYKTQADLIEQLTKAAMSAGARIRELSRSRKLEEIAAAGSTAKNVTPSTEVPTTVAELAAELIQQREQNFLLSVREALNSFQLSADWAKYRSNENAESIVLAVEKAGADPTDPQSFHEAFARMREFLVPVTAEQVLASTPTPAPIEQVAAATASAPTQRVGIATGLSSIDSSSVERTFESSNNASKFFTAAELDRMPSDQMKKLLRNPSVAKRIDAVYEEAAALRGRR